MNLKVEYFPNDTLPKGVVHLERMFDRHHDMYKWKPIIDQYDEAFDFNLGSKNDPIMIKIGEGTSPAKRESTIKCIQEYKDIFAWTYDDLKAYKGDIIQHTIHLKEGAKPFRKKLRHINPKLDPQIQKKLQKMVDANIIGLIIYSSWMANLVVVRKKSGDIRLSVEFRNLNKLSLKDNYPLPNMEHLIQRGTRVGMMSMLDGFSGYNQVLVKKEGQLKTSFTTPWRISCI
jgi:hypothetical protein